MTRTPASSPVAPAREVAYRVIRRVFEQDAYADRALAAEARHLSQRDRALATALAYGTVQRRGTLDYVLGALSTRPAERLDPPVLAAVRLGLFQLLFLDRVAAHAAVNESVELAGRNGRGGASLVNAVLRRAAGEGPGMLAALDDREPAKAAVCHSVPEWLAELWWKELGSATARRLLRSVNRPAETTLRVNSLLASRDQVLAQLPVGGRGDPDLPEAVICEEPFDARSSDLFAGGAITPQSRGSMLVAQILAPRPDERVLDLCAAPGGKTTHLAALMADRGELVAVERHPGRAHALRAACRRMHTHCVRVEIGDAAAPRPDSRFDRVLVDPPCSGLGTLRSRPDIRWRARREAIPSLTAQQREILAAGAAATGPGGVTVYSLCTISRAEGHEVVAGFLADHPDFAADELGAAYPQWADERDPRWLQLLPSRDNTDGFFIGRLRRRGK